MLSQHWENCLSRGVIYCMTVLIIYIVLLGFIIIYEPYQVYFFLPIRLITIIPLLPNSYETWALYFIILEREVVIKINIFVKTPS